MKRTLIYVLLLLLACFFNTGFADLTNTELLGKRIFTDQNLSSYKNQSCQSCHHPGAGFADMSNRRDPQNQVVSTGSDGISVGGRNAPTATYGGFSPVFHWDNSIDGYIGGMFWDGRATGQRLQDPLAEQAQGPFINPVEMALPDASAVVAIVAVSNYAELFRTVYPNADFSNVSATYDQIAYAIASYEKSEEVSPFGSKFDQFWAECQRLNINVSQINITTNLNALPQNILSDSQLEGLALFNDPTKGNCAACHITEDYIASDGKALPPLLTDFTYDNLGIPKSDNPLISANPIDYGLGGRSDISDANQNGKFKVPTLRNICKTPPYGHNGYFDTLEEIIHFYNTRDVGDWPEPEVVQNVNRTELGDLGLTPDEENAIILFMRSLTDIGK